jgi:hypothetical protein
MWRHKILKLSKDHQLLVKIIFIEAATFWSSLSVRRKDTSDGKTRKKAQAPTG